MSKRRSKSQRIGTEGENQFRSFANRHRLTANKCEEDFGTDFICQVEGIQNSVGSAPITGALVGVFVRCSETMRGRIKLNRRDVEHLLSCEYPIFVFLPHLKQSAATAFNFAFVEGEFAEKLASHLEKGHKNLYLIPTDLKEESMFDAELLRALRSGFVEQFRIELASKNLNRVIPGSRVQVRRGADGSFTLVKVTDFFRQFPRNQDANGKLYRAVFGHGSLMTQRFGEIPILQQLFQSFKHLPSPVVIAAPIQERQEQIDIVAKNGSTRSFFLTFRKSPGFFGWVFDAGFALTISESTKLEEKFVHFLRAEVDPDLPIALHKHEDLWNFLEA